jgi:hypothetical protein
LEPEIPLESTLVILNGESSEELFRLAFDVTITEPNCETLSIVHDFHVCFDNPVLLDMEISLEVD